MPPFSHWLFIDDAGRGRAPATSGQPGLNTAFVSAAVSVDPTCWEITDGWLGEVIHNHYSGNRPEIKASDIPDVLAPETTVDSFAEDIGAALEEDGVDAWLAGTYYGVRPPHNFPNGVESAPDIARRLLIERLNGYVDSLMEHETLAVLVWDLSQRQALIDFSRSVSEFKNSFSGTRRSSRLWPTVLGGLSHDWGGLQLADVISNFALHEFGVARGLRHASPEKANAFVRHIKPRLKRSMSGTQVGYKIWNPSD